MTSTPVNPIFSELINQHSTCEALLDFLKSPAGGSLTIRDNRQSPTDPYVVIHYDKQSDMTMPHVASFRSVIWDVRANRPVCAAPMKTCKVDDGSPFIVEDFIDGVMLNMFWDKVSNSWRLCSRTQLDAKNTFYSRRPFATLFAEAVSAGGLDFDDLSRDHTYSWVLQHPEERIVVAAPYGIPRLYLVETATFKDGVQEILRNPNLHLTAKFCSLLPARHEMATVKEITDCVEALGHRFGAQWKGLMVKNGSSLSKFVSPQYAAAREMRGNVAKLPFIWLERWSAQSLNQYLRLYKEETHAATSVVEAFKTCTQEAFDLYNKVYKVRAFPLRDAPQKYRKLLWDMHGAKAGAYFPTFREFMNKQDTARKLWLVNYESRYGNTAGAHSAPPLEALTSAELEAQLDQDAGLATVNAEEAALEEDQAEAAQQEAGATSPRVTANSPEIDL